MFKKSLVPKTVRVTLGFIQELIDEDGDIDETTEIVSHYFQRPKPAVRESLAEEIGVGSGRVKGKKVIKAITSFWAQHIIKVEGYDELTTDKGKPMPKGNDEWGGYFRDAIGQEHIQSAVLTLLGKLGGEETDFVKKSDSSQEE